jgi:hypothetical protein
VYQYVVISLNSQPEKKGGIEGQFSCLECFVRRAPVQVVGPRLIFFSSISNFHKELTNTRITHFMKEEKAFVIKSFFLLTLDNMQQ